MSDRKRKQHEETLREDYQICNSMMQAFPFGMDIVDEEGNILFLNTKLQDLFGSDTNNKKCWELYKDNKKQCENCPLLEGVKIDTTATFEVAGVFGGRIFDISHTGMMFRGKKAMMEIFQDITERKRTDEALKEREFFFKETQRVASVGSYKTDFNTGRWISSEVLDKIFGIDKDYPRTVEGWLALIHPDDREAMHKHLRTDVMLNGKHTGTEYRIIRKSDGELRWVRGLAEATFDEKGKILSLTGTIQDITKQKKIEEDLIMSLEKAEESDKLKSAFIHNISHEIRTPMNAIVGFSALLTEPGLDSKKQSSYVEIITQSSNQLLAIVTDIIEISNIEASLVKYTSEKINVNSILNKLLTRFSPLASEKGITFRLGTLLPDNVANIQSDANKLTQVLTNLLSNAFKFTIKGQIEFGYYLIKNNLEFYVSDTGIGIPQDEHEKIFDRFYQIESSITRRYEGTGLGLSIAKSYIEFMGGKIWVVSEPNQGSVFHFTLPYDRSDQPEIIVSENDKESEEESKKNILIAEDEENNYLLMAELLSDLDVDLVHANNGKEALEICKSGKKINLILMDIKMPVMDGHDSTREIKKMFPDIPVIALTALTFDSDKESAISSGCDGYLSKPVSKNLLLETVNKYLLD